MYVIDKIILSRKWGVKCFSIILSAGEETLHCFTMINFLLTYVYKSVIFIGKVYFPKDKGEFPKNEEERL